MDRKTTVAAPPAKIFWLAVGLCLALIQPLLADGGITFTDIADNAGITYRTIPHPVRNAILDEFYENGVEVRPGLLADTPQKPRGAPGVAIFDYDGDGDEDVYVTNTTGANNSLYSSQLRETGQLTFVDVAVAAGVGAQAHDSSGVCYGDLDNDGDEDLYVTGIGEPNILFRNNGNGTFTDITASSGAGGGNYHSSSCALADFNGDSLLDIVVGNTYDNWNHRQVVFLFPNYPGLEPNELFIQNAADRTAIRFDDASATSGVQALIDSPVPATYTWAIAAVDIDIDGDTDIVWADTQGRAPLVDSQNRGYNRILVNDGTGHFTDTTIAAGMKLGSWMGLSFGDYNCDSHMDFFSTNLGNWVGGPTATTRWFLGNGDGTFADPGLGALAALPFGWGTSTADYDNDGDQDIIFYGDDDLLTVIAMDNPGVVLQNQGCSAQFQYDLDALTTDHRFREVNGVAMGDLDHNGFEDIVTVSMFQIVPQPAFFQLPMIGSGSAIENIAAREIVMAVFPERPTFLVFLPHDLPDGDLAIEMSSGNSNNWAAVKLIGGAGLGGSVNRDAIGAVIRFTPDGGKTIIHPIVGGGSHASQDSLEANLGLGTAAKGTADILWPGGVRNRLYDVRDGERLRVPEIPCSFTAAWKNFGQYNSCVRTSLNTMLQKGVITPAERQRLLDSAVRAFNER